MLKTLIGALVLCAISQAAPECDFDQMKKKLIEQYDFTATNAEVYTLAYRNFLANQKTVGVGSVGSGALLYKSDLAKLNEQLVTQFGVNPARAAYFVRTIEAVRNIVDEMKVQQANPACIGDIVSK